MYFKNAKRIQSINDLPEGSHTLVIVDRQIIEYTGWEEECGRGDKTTLQEIYSISPDNIIETIQYLEDHNSTSQYNKYVYKVLRVTVLKIKTEISVSIS